MNIETICVCGAGTMGSGITQLCASAVIKTILFEVNGDALQKAQLAIEKNLNALSEKGKIKFQEKQEIFRRIHFTTNISDCIADLIIEAIVEDITIKVTLFNQLAKINGETTILATNTSSLSVTEIARGTIHSERVSGLHFFNPAPLMKLVEVVKTDLTSPEVVGAMVGFAKRLGKTVVVCKDSPGFIVNRVARPYYIESLRLAEESRADFAAIDSLLETTGFRMGPFGLMDLIGNDVNYAVSQSIYDQLNRPERLRPSTIQKEKVDKGQLGKKTGMGYYSY